MSDDRAIRTYLRKTLVMITALSIIGLFIVVYEINKLNNLESEMGQVFKERHSRVLAERDFEYKKILVGTFTESHEEAPDFEISLIYWIAQLDGATNIQNYAIYNSDNLMIYFNGHFDLEGLPDAFENEEIIYTNTISTMKWRFAYGIEACNYNRTRQERISDIIPSEAIITKVFITAIILGVFFAVYQQRLISKFDVNKKGSEAMPSGAPIYKVNYDATANLQNTKTNGNRPVSMKEFLTDIINAYKHIKHTNCDYEVFCDPNILLIADKKNMARVVTSILENSIVHGFANGQGKITVEVSETDKKMTMKLSDNGSGMDEEEIMTMYNTFKLGSDVAIKDQSSIQFMYNYITKELHGDISFHSHKDSGTEFIIEIPK